MKTYATLLITVYSIFLSTTVFSEDEIPDNKIKLIEDTAILFAHCYGTYSVISEIYSESNPSVSKFYKETATGAKAASSYYYIFYYTLKGTEDEDATYGKYYDYIDSIAGGKINQINAYFENEALEDIERELQICADVNELQVQAVEEMRKDLYGIK